MERILTVEQMRLADKYTIETLGVSEDVLVYRAGKAVADEIIKRFHGGRVLVCIGKGNNGADGKVIAELLSKKHGFNVSIVSVANGIFKLFDYKYDIIVDCIFGTGLNKTVEGKYRETIEKINQSGAYVVSCDIPSGLNGDNGRVMGIAVKARLTVAVQEFKTGHFLGDGLDYCGEVVAKDIGISIWNDDYIFRINNVSCLTFFKTNPRNVHKGCFGKTVIIGGSKAFSGSAILSFNALTALKCGNGYSTLVVPECLFNGCVGLNPECILNSLPDDDNGCISFCPEILNKYFTADSIAIGMGMGISEGVYQTISYILQNYDGRLLIDADGLNCLSVFGLDILKDKKCEVVLTPHIGEFSRLSKLSKLEIMENPIEYVKSFAREYNIVLLLKSAVSVLSDGEKVILNTTGCNGMAKAGSGDVLSGLTTGFLTKEDEIINCVAVGAYLFGKTGEVAQKKSNEFTLTASDIVACLPECINSL